MPSDSTSRPDKGPTPTSTRDCSSASPFNFDDAIRVDNHLNGDFGTKSTAGPTNLDENTTKPTNAKVTNMQADPPPRITGEANRKPIRFRRKCFPGHYAILTTELYMKEKRKEAVGKAKNDELSQKADEFIMKIDSPKAKALQGVRDKI